MLMREMECKNIGEVYTELKMKGSEHAKGYSVEMKEKINKKKK